MCASAMLLITSSLVFLLLLPGKIQQRVVGGILIFLEFTHINTFSNGTIDTRRHHRPSTFDPDNM